MRQVTIARPVEFEGKGIHSGQWSRVRLEPARSGGGIRFVRADLPGRPVIPTEPGRVVGTRRSTTLGIGEARVQTVEHLLASLAGMGVWHADVLVWGEELPAGDGSLTTFTQMLEEAGRQEIEPDGRAVPVRSVPVPVLVEEGEATLVALPPVHGDEGLTLRYVFLSQHRGLASQQFRFAVQPGAEDAATFAREVAPARTVAFLSEVEALRREGLAMGEPGMAVLVGEEKVLTALRFPNEVARHKLADLLGDLAVLGPLAGTVIGVASGHALNQRLTQALSSVFQGGEAE
ncbi:UDP-3-O-acyl-N-acetylglucosamine deacetylase [Limnochorda pilosa]|uniref:UDP-3-O-acyl-N-acetylglucosamine deacetylase n=1 Tax=Limnochorda pilosa TaxID=1555112 RepID=A0A0K2SPY0_LIMPI|nr:UDP-3-O-acyl-N-acetylglucosamine deacetylase [Limnochorda pilosa]BAS28894.1 UDP-3-0-acyl N-acetylglucosamine deacetylase [Limnochorda pilosa]